MILYLIEKVVKSLRRNSYWIEKRKNFFKKIFLKKTFYLPFGIYSLSIYPFIHIFISIIL